MKLQMIFILMDLFTLAVIPFAFLFEKVRRFKKGFALGFGSKKRHKTVSHPDCDGPYVRDQILNNYL